MPPLQPTDLQNTWGWKAPLQTMSHLTSCSVLSSHHGLPNTMSSWVLTSPQTYNSHRWQLVPVFDTFDQIQFLKKLPSIWDARCIFVSIHCLLCWHWGPQKSLTPFSLFTSVFTCTSKTLQDFSPPAEEFQLSASPCSPAPAVNFLWPWTGLVHYTQVSFTLENPDSDWELQAPHQHWPESTTSLNLLRTDHNPHELGSSASV